jgi:peroxiredoxin
MKKYISVLFILLLLGAAGCSRHEEKPVQAVEGSIAPDFTLKDLGGKEVRLSDLRGKIVVLNFWATWCPPCREEIPSMMHLNQVMAGKQFQMLAVSQDEDGKEAIEAYFRKSSNNLPALIDADQKIGKRYGLTGVPETFVIDKKGVILKKVVGALDWSNPGIIRDLSEAASK